MVDETFLIKRKVRGSLDDNDILLMGEGIFDYDANSATGDTQIALDMLFNSTIVDSLLESVNDDEQERIFDKNACTFYSQGKMWLEIFVMVLTVACFIFMLLCYGAIFNKLSNRHKGKTLKRPNNGRSKLVFTTMLFLVAFAVCWLPLMIYDIAMLFLTQTDPVQNDEDVVESFHRFYVFGKFLNSLMMTYPLIDPIIYAYRIPAVKRSMISQFSCIFPCLKMYIASASRPRLNSSLSVGSSPCRTLPDRESPDNPSRKELLSESNEPYKYSPS